MLATLLGSPRKRRATVSDTGWLPVNGWFGGLRRTTAGVNVDEEVSLGWSPVMCAARILCETIAGMPLILYEKIEHEDRRPAVDNYLYDKVKVSPNTEMGSCAFRTGRTLGQTLYGNGFAEIERERRTGRIANLWPIHPSRVRPLSRFEAGRAPEGVKYLVRNNDGTEIGLRPEEMLHIPGALAEDGIWGKGLIAYARESVGLGLSTERHGADYFGSGAQPPAIMFAPGFTDPEKRKAFRKDWSEIHQGPDGMKNLAILPLEAKFQQLQITNEAGQFLQTRALNWKTIAQVFRLPLFLLNAIDGAPYSSTELDLVSAMMFSFAPWCKSWEEQLNLKLLTEEERKTLYFEHNFDGLLRGDRKTRMESHRMAIQTGIESINEARRFENMPNIGPDGDAYFMPANLATVERVVSGEALAKTAPLAGGAIGSDMGGDGQAPAGQNGSQARLLELLTPKQEPSQAVMMASRKVLHDALHRLFSKEANAAKRGANGNGFDAWAEEFYAKQRTDASKVLAPAVTLLATLGIDAAEWPERVVSESRTALFAAYGTETPEQFSGRLETWADVRAKEAEEGLFAHGT